ncbi:hypothetical protein CPC08DRAFT_786976 [Agrocybe pediades]|nr:hypothetical protein CPC08DRAFT_786976 [Agrocybe pediades]
MPGVPWGNAYQLAFLNSKVDGFQSAQRDQTTSTFLKKTYEEFYQRWPNRETELLEASTMPQETKKKKTNKNTISRQPEVPTELVAWKKFRKNQIRNWFGNHGSGTQSKGGPTIVIGETKPTRIPSQVQLYSKKYYATKVQPAVEEATTTQTVAKNEMLPLITRVTYQAWLNESPEVQEEIATEIRQMKDAAKKLKNAPKDHLQKPSPEEYSAELVKLPAMIRAFCKEVAKRTGYQVSVLAGGPDPNKPGTMRTYAIHEGEDLFGEQFSASNHLYSKGVVEPFVKFLTESYTLDDINSYLVDGNKILSPLGSGDTASVPGPSVAAPDDTSSILSDSETTKGKEKDISIRESDMAGDDTTAPPLEPETIPFDPFNPDDPMFSLLDDLNMAQGQQQSWTEDLWGGYAGPQPAPGIFGGIYGQQMMGTVTGNEQLYPQLNHANTMLSNYTFPSAFFGSGEQQSNATLTTALPSAANQPTATMPVTNITSHITPRVYNPVVTVATQAEPQVPPPGQAEPRVPPSTQAEPRVPPPGQAEPRVPPSTQAEPRVPPLGQAVPRVPPPGEAEPRVPPPTQAEPRVQPPTNHHEPPLPSTRKVDTHDKENVNPNQPCDNDKRASRNRKPTTSREVSSTTSWLEATREYLKKDIEDHQWLECVRVWYEFEKKEASEQDTTSVRLAVKDRPDVLKKWMSSRKYNSTPAIPNLKDFAVQWLAWWNNLQPKWRRADVDNALPLSHDCAEPNDNLQILRKGGPSGIMSVLVGLKWWAELGSSGGAVSWEAAVEDVLKSFTFQPPTNTKRKPIGDDGQKNRAPKRQKRSK